MANPHHIKVDGVNFSWPDRRMLTDVSLTVPPGRVTGLIGENGAGKSTLISILAGTRPADSGLVTVPPSTGILTQETSLPFSTPVSELIEQAVSELRAIEQRIGELSGQLADDPAAADEFDLMLARAAASGVWEIDARIDEVLGGLGLAAVSRDTPLGGMSGGQRRRFALAMLLLRPVDALVLDEPTNHLDDAAVDFLVSDLKAFPGPVLVASHDRWFLDQVADALVDMDLGLGPEGGFGEDLTQGIAYTGSFSDYLSSRAAHRRRWQTDYNAQEQERARLRNQAEQSGEDIFHHQHARTEIRMAAKFHADRAAKTVGNRVRSARARLEELERKAIPAPPPLLTFRGLGDSLVTPIGVPAVVAKSVTVRGRLAPVSFKVQPGEHLLIEGPNGTGKSTILSLIEGALSPDNGELIVAEDLTVARLSQDDDWTDPQVPAGEMYERLVPPGSPSLVDLGLLSKDALNKPIGLLSHGQRRRVSLGAILAAPPDLLLLDEPTNHISLALSEDLENALDDFPGTVILATHDRWIRHRWLRKPRATLLTLPEPAGRR